MGLKNPYQRCTSWACLLNNSAPKLNGIGTLGSVACIQNIDLIGIDQWRVVVTVVHASLYGINYLRETINGAQQQRVVGPG